MAVHAGEDESKREHLFSASNSTKQYSQYGNQYGGFLKSYKLNIYTQRTQTLTTEILLHVHCCSSHNRWKLEILRYSSTDELIIKM